MPFRTKDTYSTQRGTYNVRKHTFTGKGPAPAGSRKVPAPRPSTAHTTAPAPVPVRKSRARTRPAPRPRRSIEHQAIQALSGHPEIQRKLRHRLAAAVAKPQAPAAPPKSPPSIPAARPPAVPKARKGTPEQRQQVRHRLQSAKTTLRRTPVLRGPLQPDQRRFDEAVAKLTKLNPRTVGAQSLAEESGSAAAQRQAEGNQNWLNIGPGAQLAPTPKGAAKETARLFNTSDYYTGIRASRGQGARAQVDAIAVSPWGTVGSTMHATLPQVSISPAKRQARARVNRLTKRAHALGMKTGVVPGVTGATTAKPRRIPSVVYIGKVAEKKFGLHVGENPAFGGVAPVHVEDSYHYRRDRKGRGEAIDASGTPEQMLAFDEWVARKYGKGITELFYDPGISIKEGAEIGAIGGHGDHVHVAEAQPGETVAGGFTAGPGGAVFVGYGPSAAAAASSASRASSAAAQGKGRRSSPWQRLWELRRRRARNDAREAATAAPKTTKTALSELERKYGTT